MHLILESKINNINPLLSLCSLNNGIAIFKLCGKINKHYTKRDCFYYMDCDSDLYHNCDQSMASFLIVKKSDFVVHFIIEWLSFCQDPRIISDEPNTSGLPNFPGYIDHRHDQSILSILAKKYSLILFRDPSQWGNNWKLEEFREKDEFLFPSVLDGNFSPNPMENSRYPTILNHHRNKRFKNADNKKHYIQYFFDRFINLNL